jgi:hypothetical protein
VNALRHRTGRFIVLVIVTASLTACASAGTPSWTFPPAPAAVDVPTASSASTPAMSAGELAAASDLAQWTDPATYPMVSDPKEADASAWKPDAFMTPSEGLLPWQIAARPGHDSNAIAGFTDRPSYAPGQTMNIDMSTAAPHYSVTFWRLDGTTSLADPFAGPLATLTDLPGTLQGAIKRMGTTKMVYTTWHPSTQFVIPSDWKPGIYLVRLDNGQQSYIPFVVRSTTPARFTVVVPMLTFQAYNRWDGSSLYWTAVSGLNDKATAVSLNRPFELSFGASRLFVHGYIPFAGWINKRNDIGWTTDYDLAVQPGTLPTTRALVFAGHTEYIPTTLRSWLDRKVTNGKFGVAYFSADGSYWPCTLSGLSATGPRVMNCAKTKTWRDAPYNNPEQKLWGSMYGFVTAGSGTFKVTSAASRAGLLIGTGLRVGSSLGAIAGGEVDQLNPRYPSAGSQIVASATSVASLTNSGSRFIGRLHEADMTIRKLANGRRVWSAASIDIVWAFNPAYAKAHGVPAAAFDRFMSNVLDFVAH